MPSEQQEQDSLLPPDSPGSTWETELAAAAGTYTEASVSVGFRQHLEEVNKAKDGRDTVNSYLTASRPLLVRKALHTVARLLDWRYPVSRGAAARLQAAMAVLDRVDPKVNQSTPSTVINAAQLAVIVGGAFHSVPPSTPASTPATLALALSPPTP
jgi:hypothetical protein